MRDVTLGNTYINGVLAGSNLQTMNDSLNAAFNLNLVQYKNFLESEVGVVGSGNTATWYYIESPDGVFHYPLFKTEAESKETVRETPLGQKLLRPDGKDAPAPVTLFPTTLSAVGYW